MPASRIRRMSAAAPIGDPSPGRDRTLRRSAGRVAGAAGLLVSGVVGQAAVTATSASAAVASPSAASPVTPAARPQVTVFASGSKTVFGPDDITRLGSDVYVTWQNGIGPAGQPSATGARDSTIIGYGPGGVPVGQWKLRGHVDGLTADPARGDLLATANEDGDSSMYSITPTAPAGQQVAHYRYSSNPLPHGGGTDAISVYGGQILVSASAPTVSSGPAVYRVTLSGATAVVQPVFFDNSSATVANVQAADHGATVTLALTDPDSNEVVPATAPRFAGDFVLDSQGDQEQIYLHGADGPRPKASVLSLSQSVDDTTFITDSTGTLYVTDSVDNAIYAVQSGLETGQAVAAVTPGDANNAPPNAGPNYLGQLDLQTGQVSPFITTVQAKGLLFVP